ncbi:MAG: carbohydrate-binding domain-containing protein [Clostridia bacterium]|nr:carbohydrate-binding domain-containing protein [Clostridia bacterium]
MFKRLSAAITAICLLFAVTALFSTPALAAVKITDTVNATLFTRDTEGHGYFWDNRYDILTLDDLYIDTTAEYGLKVPAGATVILKGDSYIKASRAALALAGAVTFKGTGSLTLVSDDMGIYCYATDKSSVIRFLDGTYTVTAGGDGIYSTHSSLSFVDGKWTINAPDAYAVNGTELKLYGGEITAEGAIHASHLLDIQAIRLRVTADTAALTSDKTMKITDVSISAGDSAEALTKKESYSGENCVSLLSTRSHAGESIFFGESVPKAVDYVVLVAFAALITAGIAIPFARARKKAQRALAESAKRQAEAEEAARAAKKATKK